MAVETAAEHGQDACAAPLPADAAEDDKRLLRVGGGLGPVLLGEVELRQPEERHPVPELLPALPEDLERLQEGVAGPGQSARCR